MAAGNIRRQGGYFVLISGLGWLLDFGIYISLTHWFDYPVSMANMISALPAVTFVFVFSTRKIFVQRPGGFGLKTKYIIYIVYQILLVASVSLMAGFLYNTGIVLLGEQHYLAFLVKCLITPITLLCNFIVMKMLVEKL